MAVNSIDYSKELNRLRDQYQKSIEENRKARQEEIENIQNTSDVKHEKELQTFSKGKREIEELFDKRLSEIRDNTQDLIDKNRTNYLEKLDTERHAFEKDKSFQKNEFNKQIDEIGESFRRANQQEKEEHRIIQANAKENQSRRLKAQSDQHMQEVDVISERSKKVDEESKLKHRDDQEKLYKKHQIELQDTKKEEVNRRLQDVSKKDEENKLIKDFFTKDLELKERLNQNNIESIKKKNDDNVNRMQESFESLANEMRVKGVQNEDRSRREYGAKLKEQTSDFEKEKAFMNKRIYEIARARDMDADTRKGAELKSADDDKLERYNQNLDTIRKDFYDKNEAARTSYLEDIDKTKLEAENKLTQEKIDSGKFMVQQNARSTKERNDTIDVYKRQNKEATKNFERMLEQQRRFNNERVSDGIVEFNKKISKMNEDSYDSLNKIREEYSQQKKDLIIKSELERVDMSEGLKRTFGDKLEDSNKQFNERLKQKNVELKNTAENYESTIRALESARVKNDRYREFLYNEKRKEDLEAWREIAKKKEEEHSSLLESLRTEYETKIDDLQNAHVDYVKKLTAMQNDLITRMQTEKMLEVKKVEKLNYKEQERLKSESQNKLDQMVFSYEDKIKQIKNNYEYEIQKLKNKIDSMGG